MAEEQKNQFNDMLGSLLEISKSFCTLEELKEEAEEAGITYQEALEGAYKSIQDIAKETVEDIEVIK